MNYLNTLEAIANTKSRNDKILLLKDAENTLLKDLLVYAYEPLKHYYVKQLPWEGHGEHTLLSSYAEWSYLLGKLSTRKLSGARAKEALKRTIEKLTPKDAELLKCILRKDLKAGISVKTINMAMPGLIEQFGAMLASKFSGTITGPVYMSLKLDGLRGVYKKGVIYSRNGIEIQGLEHITTPLRQARIESLDGELMIPHSNFQTTSGKLRSGEPCPDAVYHVFDTAIEGIPFKQRYEHLLSLECLTGHILVVKHVLTSDQRELDVTYAKAISAGYEGLVLKDPDHSYIPNTRSKHWMKLKEVQSEDLKILGVFEGEGKYEGQAGGFTVERENGVVVKVGSGLSDAMRLRMWHKPEEYIGITAEVLYHEVTPDGSLRHPRLKCLRGDK